MNYNWEEVGVQEYVNIAYPRGDQGLNIHTADVEFLVPILKEHKPKVIVEIGAAYGTSSKLFGGIAKEFGGRLYSIEPCPRKEWFDNMQEYDLLTNAELIEGASPWIQWPPDRGIDLLFIDGWHNYRNAFVDYFYWEKYVSDGGLIIFHDTIAFPAVKMAVEKIRETEFLQFVGSSKSRVGMEIYQKMSDIRGKSAFFGPWVGEFGWEVAWWQGFCRKEAKNWDYVIVSSYPGNEGFYEDFADEFVAHDLRGQPMCGFANALTGTFDFPKVTKVFAPQAKKFIPKEEQEFIQFGQDDPCKDFDILVGVSGHGRKQYQEWDKILAAFPDKKFACFGKTGAYPDGHIPGTADIRDIPLKELMRYMAGAKVVIGPCTGAMHLASYCNAKIVVWCDKGNYTFGQSLRKRFEDILNPFNNPVRIIDNYNWNSPVEEVINDITSLL